MAQTKTAIQCLTLAHRENAGRSSNSAVADDHAAVMQRRFRMKNAEKQLHRKIRIERHAGFFVNANGCVAFDCQERAKLFIGQLSHRFGEIVDRLPFLTGERKNRVAAEFGQTAPEFWLKDHDQSDGKKN